MKHPDNAVDREFSLEHVACLSRRGADRAENQDSFVADDHIWVIADGMGGHEGGRTASAVAVASVGLAVQPGDGDLAAAVHAGHYQVLVVGELMEQPTMGSTVVLAVRDPGSGAVRIAWCGDSRAYLLRDGSLTRLTRDHNLAEEELAADALADEYDRHMLIRANVLLRLTQRGHNIDELIAPR